MPDNLVCHHCPHRTFRDEVEFEAHCLVHGRTQAVLRRKGDRTYGARTSYSTTVPTTNIPSPGPILPVTSGDHGGAQSSRPLATVSVNETLGGNNGPQTQPVSPLIGHDGDDVYDKLATFMAQDKSFLLFRRFSTLNLEILLKMQAEIFELEKKFVQAKASGSSDAVSTGELVAEKLHRYNAALLQYSQLSGLHQAEKISISDLRQYIVNVAKADTPIQRLLTGDDADDADFVSLDRDRIPKNRMYRLVERLTWRFFTKTAAGGRRIELPQQGTLYTFDDNMVQTTFRAMITILTFVVLLTPIVVLSYLEKKRKMLVVIVVCTAAAATIMAMTTNCREHEIMIAASTYAAALLVYISD
ncbi:uncharacterized protein ATNIH1004_000500 [Aspergillus tanneri]|uniref:DUF6594 domain-containing protein n=1 Tax=Aspergillus tanneri TaxID=1220188 RepID=A0A5M9N1T9_9EURO|nr:uncharacterized protein ATNIH1004_000500 [Aspergillus tanneri]KAA8651610.1 hypothetical protein ATNIH1004_000500 [Aspergillus tanneri]